MSSRKLAIVLLTSLAVLGAPTRGLGDDPAGVDGATNIVDEPITVSAEEALREAEEGTNAFGEVSSALVRLEPAVDALATRLGALESALAVQHGEAMQAMANRLGAIEAAVASQAVAGRESARTILIVAGCFAAAVLLGALLAAVILSRAMNRVSEVMSAALPPGRMLGAGAVAGVLAPGGGGELAPVVAGSSSAVEQVTARFLTVIEQLERRIVELETAGGGSGGHGARPEGARAGGSNGNGAYEFSISALSQKQYGDVGPVDAGAEAGAWSSWLGKGQALLNLGRLAEAIECFDRVLVLKPGHPDALVKRGMALEKMGKPEDALACYDQAIAADANFTLAYLYKGGLCNRMERFREAVECYESALKSEQKSAGGK